MRSEQAITTKYLGPTNSRGSRYKAEAYGGSVTIAANYALDSFENHEAAAKALQKKLGWSGKLQAGGLPDGKGYCFVHVGK